MHFWIFNHRFSHQLEGLHYLVLRLPARTYSGLVGEVARPLVVLHLPSDTDGFCPLKLFCFTRCFPNTLDFWRTPLRYWGSPFRFLMSDLFSEVVTKLSANFLRLEISAWSAQVLLPPNLLSRIRYYFRVSNIHPIVCCQSLWDILHFFWLLYWGVSKVLWRTALFSWELSLEVLSRTSLLVVHWQRSDLRVSSLLSNSILGGIRISSCYVRSRE